MALSLASPGIKVREVDLTRGGINNTTSLSAGIAAPFEKGPVNQVVTVQNENDLVNLFGKPSKNNYQYEYWYSASNFLSYGGSLKVVRCSGSNLTNSNAGVGVAATNGLLIENFEDYQSSYSIGGNFYWAAKNPGYWAENLQVCVIDNFADQVLSGINTSGVSVGYAATQAITSQIPGVGVVESASGYLKAIVTGVGASTVSVKVVGTVSAAGTETAVDYTEDGVYSFNTESNVYFNGTLPVSANPLVTVTRAGFSTYSAQNIGLGTAFTLFNKQLSTLIDNAGTSPTDSSTTTIYVSTSAGITTASFLLVDSEIMDVTSVVGNTLGVTRASYGTTATSHIDSSIVSVFTVIPNHSTAVSAASSTATSIEISSTTNLTAEDLLLVQGTNEIMYVESVSTSSSSIPSTVVDWYNTQNVLDTSRGDSSTIAWRSIAPRPKTNQYVLGRGGNNDALHVVVIDSKRSNNISGSSQTILEKFTNLSKALDTQISPSQKVYYKSYIAENSQYIYAGASFGDNVDDYWNITPVSSKFSSGTTPQPTSSGVWGTDATNVSYNVIGNQQFALTNGKDYSGNSSIGGYEVTLSDITNAYDKLSNETEIELSFLLQGSASLGKEIEQAKANKLISIAEARKDCVAFISPYRDSVVNVSSSAAQLREVLSFFSPLTSSSYAVFDSGYQYVYDRFNQQFIYMPCSADVAGLCVRTDINQFPWYSPAGKTRGTLNFPIKLAYNPNLDDRDKLYAQRINPVISSPGSGIILFGDKTALSYQSAFDRINVRRLFISLEQAVKSAADAQLFEFNDSTTRANFINIVEPYLRDVRAKRGITDFLLVCDETNNTADVIDRNEFIADIYVKPARSINFIGLTFVATRTGVSFETIVGTV
jgi:phage tail sheath protein FI